jgi:hypothetical protein
VKKLTLIVAITLVTATVLGLLGVGPALAAKGTFPEIIPLPDGWQPEGIAVGRGASFYVGSLLTGAVYGGDLRTGEGEIVVPPQEGRIAVGLAVDTPPFL